MKKYLSVAALVAALGAAPTVASAHSWKHHHHYDDGAGAGLVVIGAGAGAGAIIAGPVGAVVGGAAGLLVTIVGGGL